MPTRREFGRVAGLGLAAAALSPRRLPAADQPQAANRPPNFVVILIDDMGYGDVEPFGSKVNRTPNLNRMAAEGLKLTSFYAAPVCTPSRAQMMTGCYAKRVSLPSVIPAACPIGLNPAEPTVASLLKARGYATMCIGKWHLGDQPDFLPTRHGFDHYLGLPYSNDMSRPDVPLPLLRDEAVIEAPADQDTLTRRYTEEAVKFIEGHKDQPFFLYLPHTAVHVPLHPGPQFAGKSANGKYGDWVEESDWSVGQVLDCLVRLGIERQTLVLFSSDNGPWLIQGRNGGVAGPLRNGKGSTWEGGVREPTIAWQPGTVPAGASCDAVLGSIDVLPTLVKRAGAELGPERVLDGRDMWPVLSGQTQNSPHEAWYYFNGNRLEAVRCGRWKLAIAPQRAGIGPNSGLVTATRDEPRLYDLEADLGETTDVARQHPEVVSRMRPYIRRMDADLAVRGLGPGVRPPGRVAQPQGLRRVAMEYD
jgi:arylsulfatase A-like enzyme